MRDERGEFSLIGLLVAIMIFGFVLSATYAAFDVFGRNVRNNQVRTEATDRARNATDALARQLRNMATPTALQPNAISLASSYDMVFETVAPAGTPPAANPQNVEFVRYCLDTATRKVWTMVMLPSTVTSATVAPSSASACPGGGSWSNAKVVAQDVVNVYNGKTRPVFSFDSTVLNQITRVRTDLYVDPDPATGPAEQQITTGVTLRNQDRAPVAAFTATPAGGGVVLLDASTSTDPDNDPLSYCWYDLATSASVGTCGTGSISSAQFFKYTTTTGSKQIKLVVTDPSGLPSTVTKTVSVS
jgi:type II secretory pathway pseudopilin PulG